LNAGVAQWLLSEGLAPERYVVSQGTAIGRAGRLRIERQGDEIWVGGAVVACIEGRLQL
jgi:predicted PhzF superfamily epimerase YddE/YHI9